MFYMPIFCVMFTKVFCSNSISRHGESVRASAVYPKAPNDITTTHACDHEISFCIPQSVSTHTHTRVYTFLYILPKMCIHVHRHHHSHPRHNGWRKRLLSGELQLN